MLQKYGLSNYENKVYLKMLELGKEDAKTISKLSEVPQGRIYDILESLIDKQLVFQKSGRPRTYEAVDPETGINLLINKRETELKKMKATSTEEIKELVGKYRSQTRDKLSWKVAIGDEIKEEFAELLAKAKHEILSYVDVTSQYDGMRNELYQINHILSKLQSKGIKLKIIIGIEVIEALNHIQHNDPEFFKILDAYDIRITQTITTPFFILDGQKLLLKISQPTKRTVPLAALYIDEPKLGESMKREFNEMWENGEEIEMRLQFKQTTKHL